MVLMFWEFLGRVSAAACSLCRRYLCGREQSNKLTLMAFGKRPCAVKQVKLVCQRLEFANERGRLQHCMKVQETRGGYYD